MHDLNNKEALLLARETNTDVLMKEALELTYQGFGSFITYSPKVFIPLTHLCRDVCHYCTFAKTPKRNNKPPYMSIKDVVDLAKKAEKTGCKEALFTLGERPELRYSTARKALHELGHDNTLRYLQSVAEAVLSETNLLPHLNPGCMDLEELDYLKPVSASMGIMLENSSERLSERGGPHFGSPDKQPKRRLEAIRNAGLKKIPFTTGILIGIGETRLERIQSLLDIRELHSRYGHIQEVIIQNFRPKPDTKMSNYEAPLVEDLLWTIAVARLIFGSSMSIQAPPNLSPQNLDLLINAGINDWGGVSPITPDFVNPEAPWPHLTNLSNQTLLSGKILIPRLTIYPKYIEELETWVDQEIQPRVLRLSDSSGYARENNWSTGRENIQEETNILSSKIIQIRKSTRFTDHIKKVIKLKPLSETEIADLFDARGPDFEYVTEAAHDLSSDIHNKDVSYVINRNINYTNICYFHCTFCAFSKGKTSEKLRGKPYDISLEEIIRRCKEAYERGATEVCLQGGIHPAYTGDTYREIVKAIRHEVPGLHIHAFSPLEIYQGAKTLGISISEFLKDLKDLGLRTLPGTAAEILDDEVRHIICKDKINSSEWLEVMEKAHKVGINSTATIMFGHVDTPLHWSRHLIKIRDLQAKTMGFTEFVPLPFVPMEAPMFLKGKSRFGPTLRESVLMHSIARLSLYPNIKNIQTSWVKMGISGIKKSLNAGANDIGGTLMNESITRAAGAEHGQEFSFSDMKSFIKSIGREPIQRDTLYQRIINPRLDQKIQNKPLDPIKNELVNRQTKDRNLIKSESI